MKTLKNTREMNTAQVNTDRGTSVNENIEVTLN